MRGSTFPFAPMKTYGLIFVDLREKRIFFLSLSFLALTRSPLPFVFFPLFHFLTFYPLFYFILNFDTWITLRYVSISHLGPFLPRSNLFIFNSVSFK